VQSELCSNLSDRDYTRFHKWLLADRPEEHPLDPMLNPPACARRRMLLPHCKETFSNPVSEPTCRVICYENDSSIEPRSQPVNSSINPSLMTTAQELFSNKVISSTQILTHLEWHLLRKRLLPHRRRGHRPFNAGGAPLTVHLCLHSSYRMQPLPANVHLYRSRPVLARRSRPFQRHHASCCPDHGWLCDLDRR
jgi:hypothetical protein